MAGKCVITGDVIAFTSHPPKDRQAIMKQLLELLRGWSDGPGKASVFRGDSFQFLADSPAKALQRAIQVRCWLRYQTQQSQPKLDARMVIGYGSVAYLEKNILESDGEAFHLSGRAFDSLSEEIRMIFVTSNESINQQVGVMLGLAEVIMNDWTANQCEVLYHYLEQKTQQEIAELLNLGQPAVHSRLKLANWKPIARMCEYIDELIRGL